MKLENKQIGDYRLNSLIGKGGMAEVWLASQMKLNRQIAIKVIPEILADEDEDHFVERLANEAQAIARLEHSNILPIIDFGSSNGFVYLVMPYMRGGSLQQLLNREMLSRHNLAVIYRDILNGLSFIHGNGFIHRDLKPANILFYADGRAVISDFGMAKDVSNKVQLTMSGFTVGSPEYMSPEQFMGVADSRCDLYAMGVILYQMLTGRVPYSGSTALHVGMRHLNDPLPLPDPLIPVSLEMFLRQALQKKPQYRFDTVQNMTVAFNRAINKLSSEELNFQPSLPIFTDQKKVYPPLSNLKNSQPGAAPAARKVPYDSAVEGDSPTPPRVQQIEQASLLDAPNSGMATPPRVKKLTPASTPISCPLKETEQEKPGITMNRPVTQFGAGNIPQPASESLAEEAELNPHLDSDDTTVTRPTSVYRKTTPLQPLSPEISGNSHKTLEITTPPKVPQIETAVLSISTNSDEVKSDEAKSDVKIENVSKKNKQAAVVPPKIDREAQIATRPLSNPYKSKKPARGKSNLQTPDRASPGTGDRPATTADPASVPFGKSTGLEATSISPEPEVLRDPEEKPGRFTT